jgi:GNAT superfamily N-acetyltransferase
MIIEKAPPSATELARFYSEAGWLKDPNIEEMQKAVDSPSEWFTARDMDSSLLGMGRIVTDYVRYAVIVDLIVRKSQQGQGIGTKIMEAILEECRLLDIDSVNLWPSKGKVPFYERFGFYGLPADQPHMKLKKK